MISGSSELGAKAIGCQVPLEFTTGKLHVLPILVPDFRRVVALVCVSSTTSSPLLFHFQIDELVFLPRRSWLQAVPWRWDFLLQRRPCSMARCLLADRLVLSGFRSAEVRSMVRLLLFVPEPSPFVFPALLLEAGRHLPAIRVGVVIFDGLEEVVELQVKLWRN
jgi:hypothetical protein